MRHTYMHTCIHTCIRTYMKTTNARMNERRLPVVVAAAATMTKHQYWHWKTIAISWTIVPFDTDDVDDPTLQRQQRPRP